MLRKTSIGMRLKGSFGAFGFLILAIALLSLYRMGETARVVSEEHHIRTTALGPLYELREALDQTGIAARNAYIYQDETAAYRELDVLDLHRATYLKHLRQLQPHMSNNAEFVALSEKLNTMGKALQRPREFRDKKDMTGFSVFLLESCSPLRRQIVVELNTIIGRIEAKLAEAGANVNNVVDESQKIIGAITAVIAVGAAVLAWLVTASIVRPLAGAAKIAESVATGDLTFPIRPTAEDELGLLIQSLGNMQTGLKGIVKNVRSGSARICENSREIAAGNLHLSTRTEAQASALQQTAATMHSLTSTVRENAADAQSADELAREASRIAAKGGAVVEDVVATMNDISQASRQIVDIIGLIDGLAFQTNILALNAAVEAARAGEQGRGFAVVASEVRELAQRSGAAAKQIRTLIHASVSKVENGTTLVNQTGSTMQDLMHSVEKVSAVIRRIASASELQATGVQEVNQAVDHIDDLTQQNAALVEQAAAAASQMHEQAEELERHVSVFRVVADQPNTTDKINRLVQALPH